MPVQSMQAVAEHQLFKAATPVIAAALIGSVTWLFVTVIQLDKDLRVTETHMTNIDEDIQKLERRLDDLQNKITDLRINQGSMKSRLENTKAGLDYEDHREPFHRER